MTIIIDLATVFTNLKPVSFLCECDVESSMGRELTSVRQKECSCANEAIVNCDILRLFIVLNRRKNNIFFFFPTVGFHPALKQFVDISKVYKLSLLWCS